jgi:hypothetical protein
MKPKYTPGTWIQKWNLVQEIGPSGLIQRTIATVGILWSYENQDEAQEYTRLIASAPELLEAVQAAEQWINGDIGPGRQEEILLILRGALKKAEGDKE